MPRTTILGLQGSGKTYLAKHHLLDDEPNHLVIDPNGEYDGYTRYVPKYPDSPAKFNEEIRLVMRKIVLPNCQTIEAISRGEKPKKNRLKLLVIDEADLVAPARQNINSALRYAVVNARHLQLDIVFISRRPTDLNTYIMDTCDYLISFKQTGYNAIKVLKMINEVSPDKIRGLDYDKYEFILYDRARACRVYTLDTLPPGALRKPNLRVTE